MSRQPAQGPAPDPWREIDEDLRRHADRGRVLVAFWMGVGTQAIPLVQIHHDAEACLNELLLGESRDLPNRTGWISLVHERGAICGPFKTYVGRWTYDDLNNWTESYAQLSQLLANEDSGGTSTVVDLHDWITHLFYWLLNTTKLFEGGLEGYWTSHEPAWHLPDLDATLKGGVNRAADTRRMKDNEGEQILQFFDTGEAELPEGYYCLLLREDIRRMSRRAIRSLVREPGHKGGTGKRKRKAPEQDRIRKQRIDFAKPMLDENGDPKKSWQKIYEEYTKKFPEDEKASAATIRLSVQRDPMKSDSSDS